MNFFRHSAYIQQYFFTQKQTHKMKKTILLSLLIFLGAIPVFAQYNTNQNKVWAFGDFAGLDFTSGSPVAFLSYSTQYEGCASVSNGAGQLLFYTDGKHVIDSAGYYMPHGSSIVPVTVFSSAQAAVIVPVPNTANKYYVFSSEQYPGGHLYYSFVDMSLDGGNGDVDSATAGTPLATAMSEAMVAVRGNNCNVWLITHRRDSAVFLVYSISPSGISGPVVSHTGAFTGTISYGISIVKPSHNGKKLVLQDYDVASSGHGTELYDFDPTTGIVSGLQILDSSTTRYGAEFSPNDSLLYIDEYGTGYVAQYNISLSSTAAIVSSLNTITTTGGVFGDMKLGPDNKIYITSASDTFLARIGSPNTYGTGCGFVSHGVTLIHSTNGEYGLPSVVFPNIPGDTAYTSHDTTLCMYRDSSVVIYAHDTGAVWGYLWNDDTTTTRGKSITATGTYWVRIFNGCNLTIDTIHVGSYTVPTPITGDLGVCTATTLTDSVTGGTWSSGSPGIATIGASTGIVTSVTLGTTLITYRLSDGCAITETLTVNPLPAPITGATSICVSDTATLHDTASGGVWSSSSAVATVGSGTGFVTGGASYGVVTVTYTIAATGCYTTYPVTVGVPPITGVANVCAYDSPALYIFDAAAGGGWTSTLVGVFGFGSSEVVQSFAAGLATIYYTMPGGCFASASLTVYPLPAPIAGDSDVCVGETIALSDVSTGGTWSRTNTHATVGFGTGIVTGVSAGVDSIIYTLPTGCTQQKKVTVNPFPTSISGTTTLCPGTSTTLTGTPGGGTWSSSATGVATVSTGGVVTGVTAGTAVVTYTSAGCPGTVTVVVNPLPAGITGGTSICQGGKDTLLDASSGGSWSSGSTGVATVGASTGIVTGLTAGHATITYTLGTGCIATTAITINDTIGSCTACEVFRHRSYARLGAGGSIGTTVGAGFYYIANDVAITDTVTMTDAIVLIAPGVTVSVNPTASLTTRGSHLLGECGMWNGIVLLNDGVSNTGIFAGLEDAGGTCSMIEDAAKAVTVINAKGTATSLVKCDNVIFNRNTYGLDIEKYYSLVTAYPFTVRNTVFTSRDFTGYTGYPFAWPQASALKALYAPGSVFAPPYSIDDFSLGYTGVNCKDGGAAYAGIKLSGIGSYTAAPTSFGPPIPGYYAGIVVGDTAQTTGNKNLNIFDNLQNGIFALNSNVTSVNNVFMYMWPVHLSYGGSTLIGGDGVYAATTDNSISLNRLQVYTPTGSPYHNQFYGFYIGVECYNYMRVTGQNNYMINSGSTTANPTGVYGYCVKTAQYDTVSISTDTINNVSTCIAFWATNAVVAGTAPATHYPGLLQINNNEIVANPSGYVFDMIQNVGLGIAVQGTLTAPLYTGLGSGANWSEINNNHMHDVTDGLFVNNFESGVVNTVGNVVTLRPTKAKRLYYGINHTLCHGSNMYDNIVTTSADSAGSDSMRAYYAASNMGINVGCNTEYNTGRGYEFFLQNHGSAWHDNSMDDNLKGYVLNGATIGKQQYGGHPMNNNWAGSGWSSSHPQTYIYHGANATQDTLYTSYLPIYNDGNPTPQIYSTVNGSLQYQAVYPYGMPCPFAYDNTDSLKIRDAKRVARQQIEYANNIIANNWIAQYELWKSIKADTSLIDSSAVIAKFATMAVNSRYKYLTDLDSMITIGDFADATVALGYNIDSMANTSIDTTQGVQMADNIGADNIVENYQNFYALFMKYADGALTSTDSLQVTAMAQLCPEINGNVVYQARALYSNVFNDLSVFNDDSCLDVDTGYIAARHSTPPVKKADSNQDQQYQLFPNPNDGNFIIRQYVPDNEPVAIEINDMLGRGIYKAKLQFVQAKSVLNLNSVVPGIYLLKLTDSHGTQFMFKFVVE